MPASLAMRALPAMVAAPAIGAASGYAVVTLLGAAFALCAVPVFRRVAGPL
jgi:hypothetical protein